MTYSDDGNRRCEARHVVSLPARLTWKDEVGRGHSANARVVDISSKGIGIESPYPVVAASTLIIRVDSVDLTVSGTVQTCAWKGSLYRLGVRCPAATR